MNEDLSSLTADEIMSKTAPIVESDMPLSHAVNALLKTGEKYVVVIDQDDSVIGVITPRVFLLNVLDVGPFWKESGSLVLGKQVDLIAKRDLTKVESKTYLGTIIRLLTKETPSLDYVLVEEEDSLVGIVSVDDVLNACIDSPCLSNQVSDVLPGDAIERVTQRYSTITHVLDIVKTYDTDCVVVTEAKNEPWGLITASRVLFEGETISAKPLKKERITVPTRNIEITEEAFPRIQVKESSSPLAETVAIPIPAIFEPQSDLNTVMKRMLSEDVDGLPIMDKEEGEEEGILLGALIKKDIMKHLNDQKQRTLSRL